MAKAAATLAISQPAVSKAIADMEHAFGLRLLDRNRGGIKPTAYGSALVKRGQAIFDEIKLGVEELAFLADPTIGDLHIGSTESVAAGFLPAVIERFSREQPRVRLDVAQAVLNEQHYRELRERSIDLLLGRIPTPFGENDLDAEVLYDDQVIVVASRNSKWARVHRLEACRLGRRALDTAACGHDAGLTRCGVVRCRWHRDAARPCDDAFNASLLPARREGEVRDSASSVRVAVWQLQQVPENPADKASPSASAGRYRNAQESHP